MQLTDILLLILAGFAAGLVNTIAGGGTFFSFPALLWAGVPPVSANATNSVALWPASLAGAWAYRQELRKYRRMLVPLAALSLVGGVAGGLLLISIQDAVFSRLIPWLLLFATLLFAASRHLASWAATRRRPDGTSTLARAGYLLVAVYGGFFGAGMCILLLAALAIAGHEDIHELNAIKNLLTAVIYSVSVATFVAAGAVSWLAMAATLVGATLGGFYGAQLSRLVSAAALRRIVIGIGLCLSAIYFIKAY